MLPFYNFGDQLELRAGQIVTKKPKTLKLLDPFLKSLKLLNPI